MKKLKIGVVGTGVMGLGHCDSCQKLDEVELTAVCDVDEAVVEGVAIVKIASPARQPLAWC